MSRTTIFLCGIVGAIGEYFWSHSVDASVSYASGAGVCLALHWFFNRTVSSQG
jgi:hypothetical protein